MKRGGGLKRTTRMKAKNTKRGAKRVADDEVYGSYFRYVKTLPCAVAGDYELPCVGDVTGHHIKSVGAGGKDAANCVPLCVYHHREIHDIGPKRFDARYFNDLRLYADMLWRRYRAGFEDDA